MRITTVCLALILGIGFVLTSTTTNSQQPGVAVPAGGYTATCHVSSYSATTYLLTASCRTAEGNWFTGPALDVSKCGGGISNIEGVLNCPAQAGSWGFGGAIPGGDYQRSCHNMTVLSPNGYNVAPQFLQANCEQTQITNGHGTSAASTTWPLTKLDLSNCQMGQRIWNQGGQLQCTAKV